MGGKRLRKGFPAADIGFDAAQELFEMDVLDPASDDLQALEDRVAGFDQGFKFLIEHDEVPVLDLFSETDGLEPGLFPVPGNR